MNGLGCACKRRFPPLALIDTTALSKCLWDVLTGCGALRPSRPGQHSFSQHAKRQLTSVSEFMGRPPG